MDGFFFDSSSLDGTIRVPGEGSDLDGLRLDNAGNSRTPESQMTDSLVLASGSGEVPGPLSRIKRGILFPSGVQLCSQETVKQALQNHLDYFHLRGMVIRTWPNKYKTCVWLNLKAHVCLGDVVSRAWE